MVFLTWDDVSRGLNSTWATPRVRGVCSALVPAEGLGCQMLRSLLSWCMLDAAFLPSAVKGKAGGVGAMRAPVCPIPFFMAGFTLHPGKAAC